jgi:hypothetical protein
MVNYTKIIFQNWLTASFQKIYRALLHPGQFSFINGYYIRLAEAIDKEIKIFYQILKSNAEGLVF